MKRTNKETMVKKEMPVSSNTPLVVVEGLKLGFRNKATRKYKTVIRETGFELKQGEVLSIIGESGSGKTVITSALTGLLPGNAKIFEGKIIVNGTDVTNFKEKQWAKSKLRGQVVTTVFQDPMTTLNPTIKIGKQIIESIMINKRAETKKEAWNIAVDFLKRTRISNAEQVMNLYPHQLSGGMKQRCVIAAALTCKPKILILDEPTTALDPTVQAEILDIIKELKEQLKIGVIFITHDLGVVSAISDRIAIMYAGQIVEYGKTAEIMWNPKHPYTWGLIQSMPDVNDGERLVSIQGTVPQNLEGFNGDAFVWRNDYALAIDFNRRPPFFKVSETHYAATWLLSHEAPEIEIPKIIKNRWIKFRQGNYA